MANHAIFYPTFHGHLEGDRVLARAAEALAAALAPRQVYRVGGDDFAVFIEGSAAALASRAVEAVAGLEIPFHHPEVRLKQAGKLTASAGAVLCRTKENGTELLERLREAVYMAKQKRPAGIHLDLTQEA